MTTPPPYSTLATAAAGTSKAATSEAVASAEAATSEAAASVEAATSEAVASVEAATSDAAAESPAAADAPAAKKIVSYLTLGDGDFTYSLDLCRYLLSSSTGETTMVHVTCTGMDSLSELQSKYTDTPCILQRLGECHFVTRRRKLRKQWQRQSSKQKKQQTVSSSTSQTTTTTTTTTVHNNRNNNLPAVPPPDEPVELHVSVQHQVNAISFRDDWKVPPPPRVLTTTTTAAVHHVIFNHPHLGLEDAALHQRFLRHFLDSVQQHWFSNHQTCALHLTLFQGQCQRWNCLPAAQDAGLTLIHTQVFTPPPVVQPTYQNRRHGNGKTFPSVPVSCGARRGPPSWRIYPESETLTFVPQHQQEKDPDVLLPWVDEASWQHKGGTTSFGQVTNYPCPHCDKTFGQERSVQNHVRNVHASLLGNTTGSHKPNKRAKRKQREEEEEEEEGRQEHEQEEAGETNQDHTPCPSRQRDVDLSQMVPCGTSPTTATATPPPPPAWSAQTPPPPTRSTLHVCTLCTKDKPTAETPRCFATAKALEDHVLAKHSGLCTYIPPDWKSTPECKTEANHKCAICGFQYQSPMDAQRHEAEFLPLRSIHATFTCRFCSKAFPQQRSQLQHENSCALKNNTVNGAS